MRRSATFVGALVAASHPAPTFAVTLVAVLLAVSADAAGTVVALVGLTVLVGQLSIGWSNDWLDAERDAAAGRADKPTTDGSVSPVTLRTAAFVAGATSVPVSLAGGWSGLWHLVLVASGWAYNVGLKSTRWSPVPYAVGFGALPIYVMRVAGVEVSWWLPVAGALLGLAAHFANAAPDIAQDRDLGVLGLPQRIGSRRSLALALVLLGCAGGLLLRQVGLGGAGSTLAALLVVAPLLVGAALLSAGKGVRSVFILVMVAAVTDVALLVAAA